MTGIVVVARLGSTRLKQKHLIQVGGHSFIDILILRIHYLFNDLILQDKIKIVIATSDEPENRLFERNSINHNYEVFYGDVTNIPLRQLQCAEHFGFDTIISVDGDDILCSVDAMFKVYNLLHFNINEFIKTSGLPLGMNIMGYHVRVLKEALKIYNGPDILETGWGKIFNQFNQVIYTYTQFSNIDDLRMTLDYDLDAQFFKKIIEMLDFNTFSISDLELIDFIKKNDFQSINKELNNEYWLNFNKQK